MAGFLTVADIINLLGSPGIRPLVRRERQRGFTALGDEDTIPPVAIETGMQ